MQVLKAKPGYKIVKSLFGKYEETPSDWEYGKLSDLTEKEKDIVAGPFGSNLVVNDYRTEGVPIIRLQNIERNFFINKNIRFISKEKAEELKYHSYQPDDLVLAKLGDPIGKTCRIPKNFPAGIVVADVVRIRTSTKKSDSRYIEYVLNSEFCERQLIKEKIGTTRPRVNLKQIRNLGFPIPPKPEQQKIASILTNVDNLIQKTDNSIKKTKLLKKGLEQNILTKGIGHTRFKKVKWLFRKEIEIPDEWNWEKIYEVFDLRSGSTPSRSERKYFEGNIPWVTSTDLNRGIITNTLEKISDKAVQDTNLRIYPKGTFLIAIYGLEAKGTRGKCGILGMDSTINQACMVFLDSGILDPRFLFHFYLQFGEKIDFAFAQGTKQQNLSENTLKFLKIPIPTKDEQQQIVSILSSLDSKIEKLERCQGLLKNFKKGLMQKLLTGQIRVKI